MSTLRELFRNLQAWRALYEAEALDSITGPDGEGWSLWDVEYLYRQLPVLPLRQRQAIELCLVQNVKEADAAVLMGVSVTNPVAMYATEGLKKLIAMIQAGAFPQFRWQPSTQQEATG